MKNSPKRSVIRPKISTMPRKKNEASCQLELYQMVTEKERLQKELYFIRERTSLLNRRLTTLNHQIEETEKTIKKLRKNDSDLTNTQDIGSRENIYVESIESVQSDNYNFMEIEY
ncbi:hypothetical protein [Nodularia spumigena]|nr:hypothetical protein [Nodularia spumigena]MDB9400083.1 gas vesicle protein [Microcystis aeruginosa CS-567/02-A1]MDB9531798.1 hypothetical protein [Nodularia spumigena CS-1038]MDB9305641.1 hypothetical protein [Nodularia spumigena CS-591/12]MDB9316215.1 hypothetical protein [Nodularia spumigena CS-590/01A]MDB9321809.1 hypothetical protein [Nodularia spumigena CS-591/07A]